MATSMSTSRSSSRRPNSTSTCPARWPRRWSTGAWCNCRASPTSRTFSTARAFMPIRPGRRPTRKNTARIWPRPKPSTTSRTRSSSSPIRPTSTALPSPARTRACRAGSWRFSGANGGDIFDENWKPIFNSEAGVAAVNWFKDIYDAKAVPAGTVNYTWDDIGQAMAAGQLAIDLDWPGFAGYYSDPTSSKIADDLGFATAPVGSAGIRGGWSGSHSFSVTQRATTRRPPPRSPCS